MSAADSIAALERNGALMQRMRVIGLGIAVAVVLVIAGFCGGVRHAAAGAAAPQLAQLQVEHQTITDTIVQVEHRLVVDTLRAHVAAAKADTARARSDSANAALLAIADTSATLPSALVVPAIHLCNDTKAADTSEVITLRAELADMTEDRDYQRDRADNDEAQAKIFKPPKLTFTEGVIVATTVTLAATHPATTAALVVKAGRFLLGLVR